MKSKQLLRFYFGADRLNRALDNLMTLYAMRAADGDRGALYYAEKISEIDGKKLALSRLWGFLDGVLSCFNNDEKEALRFYAELRTGISRLSGDKKRQIKRLIIRFVRHARGIERFGGEIKLLGGLYCLI